MDRKIAWRSRALDDIELVYEKVENNQGLASLLETLETQALAEAKQNVGMLKTGAGNVLKPEQFDSLSDTDKETVIKVLGNAGLDYLNTDYQTATIIIELSPLITKVQACTIFNVLNRIEKLDGAITIVNPKWKLNLRVPLGGKKGLFQWEMLILQLYPWLSVSEKATNKLAVCEDNEMPGKTTNEPLKDPFAVKTGETSKDRTQKTNQDACKKPSEKTEKKSFWKRLFG